MGMAWWTLCLTSVRGVAPVSVAGALLNDYARTGAKGRLSVMEAGRNHSAPRRLSAGAGNIPARQVRHLPA